MFIAFVGTAALAALLGWGYAYRFNPGVPRLFHTAFAMTYGLIALGLGVVASFFTQVYVVRLVVYVVIALGSVALWWRHGNDEERKKLGLANATAIFSAIAIMFDFAWSISKDLPRSWQGSRQFYQDYLVQMSWVTESMGRVPEVYPWVSELELRYTWFFHGVMGALGETFDLGADQLLSVLWPFTFAALFPVLCAAVAWQISEGNKLAVAVATLGPVLSSSLFGLLGVHVIFPITPVSPTRDFAHLVTLTLVYQVVRLLRMKVGVSAQFVSTLSFILVLSFVGQASKGSSLAVVLGGTAWIVLLAMLRFRQYLFAAMASLFGVAVGGFLAQNFFVKSTHYLTISPLHVIQGDATRWKLALVVLGILALQAAIVAGFAVFRANAIEVLLLVGMVLAGVGGLAIFNHPGNSQHYFYKAAYPFLWIGIGLTLAMAVELVNKYRSPVKRLLVIAAVLPLFIHGSSFAAEKSYSKVVQNSNTRGITANQLAALKFIRSTTSPETLLISNRHCYSGAISSQDCSPVWSAVSAYSQRRVLVEGYSYTWRSAGEPSEDDFWDRELLERNDRYYREGADADCSWLRARGAEYAFVDTRLKTVEPQALGEVVFARPSVVVVRLTCS